jgi:hypothetical protein
MTSSESEWDSEEDCHWEWDVPQQGKFAHGKNIGVVTYREMYETVIQWHTKEAGEQHVMARSTCMDAYTTKTELS